MYRADRPPQPASVLIVFFMGSWRQASADIQRALAAALVLSTPDKHSEVISGVYCLVVFGVAH